MFSSSAPSDYKTLQELAEEERQQSANPDKTQLAGIESPAQTTSPSATERWATFPTWKRDSKTEQKSTTVSDSSGADIAGTNENESAGPLNRLLAFGGRKKGFESDPFLESDTAVSNAADAPQVTPAKRQSEEERLAELDRKRDVEKKQAAPAPGPALDSKLLPPSFEDSTEEAERLFADATRAASVTTAAPDARQSTKSNKAARTSTNPADELEALLAKSESLTKTNSTGGELQLASAESSSNSDEGYEDMFRALQAGFETPGMDSDQQSLAKDSGQTQKSDESTNPFDLLLADTTSTKSTAAAVKSDSSNVTATSADSRFEDFLGTAGTVSSLRRPRQQSREQAMEKQIPVESDGEVAERLWDTASKSASADPFEQTGLAVARPLAEDADFPWKPASEASFAARNASAAGQPWWNSAESNSRFEAADQNDRDSASGARSGFSAGDQTIRSSSLTRNPGFEDAPPYNTVSFETEFASEETAPAGVVAAVDKTPVVSVLGKGKWNTLQNWFLLIGGIVVAILLFAPKRMKPLDVTATSTTVRN